MRQINRLGIRSIIQGYRSGSLDPLALLEACLGELHCTEGRIRSYISIANEARLDSLASQYRWKHAAPLGGLDGIPVAVKDNIDVAGLPCTAGTEAFRARMPSHSAEIVRQLKAHGAIIVGKTNMHEGALGVTTDNERYGRCMNPLHAGHSPGGSSGGSAAAVAQGTCTFALGTDTMGSVRIPAAFCGLFAYKPSRNRISTAGVIPLSPTLDTVGYITRSLDDLFEILSLTDPSLHRDTWEARQATVRVGIPRQLGEIGLRGSVRAVWDSFLAHAEAAGAEIVDVDIKGWSPPLARRAALLVSEAEAAQYWTAQLGPELKGLTEGFAAMLRYPDKAGETKLAAAYECLRVVDAAWSDALSLVDCIAMPTSPTDRFLHHLAPVDTADLTVAANITGAPAVVFPFSADRTIGSVQLIASPGADGMLLDYAEALSEKK